MNGNIQAGIPAFSKTVISDEICYIDNFISAQECSFLLDELSIAFWQPSLTYQKQEDNSYQNVLTAFRRSETAHQEWFNEDLNDMIRVIEERIVSHFHIKTENLENWQATDYPLGGKFDYHLDAGYWDDHYAGDRILTFLLYLRTAEEGGGTHFRAMDQYIDAKACRLLVWSNLFPNGDCDHRMVHSGAPLIKGRKTTLVSWERQKKYRI